MKIFIRKFAIFLVSGFIVILASGHIYGVCAPVGLPSWLLTYSIRYQFPSISSIDAVTVGTYKKYKTSAGVRF